MGSSRFTRPSQVRRIALEIGAPKAERPLERQTDIGVVVAGDDGNVAWPAERLEPLGREGDHRLTNGDGGGAAGSDEGRGEVPGAERDRGHAEPQHDAGSDGRPLGAHARSCHARHYGTLSCPHRPATMA